MNNYTQEQIQNRVDNLPSDIKEAINSLDTTKMVIEIGQNNKLHVDQIGELSDEVGLTMLGFHNYEKFTDSLLERIHINKDMADNITKEVNEKIFLKLKESIKKIHERHSVQNVEIDNRPLAEKMNPLEQEHEGEVLNKDKILAEIENPENIIENKVATPSVNINVQIPVIEPPMPAEPFKMNIMETKLGGVTKLPIQEKKAEETEIKIDPYREPIE